MNTSHVCVTVIKSINRQHPDIFHQQRSDGNSWLTSYKSKITKERLHIRKNKIVVIKNTQNEIIIINHGTDVSNTNELIGSCTIELLWSQQSELIWFHAIKLIRSRILTVFDMYSGTVYSFTYQLFWLYSGMQHTFVCKTAWNVEELYDPAVGFREGCNVRTRCNLAYTTCNKTTSNLFIQTFITTWYHFMWLSISVTQLANDIPNGLFILLYYVHLFYFINCHESYRQICQWKSPQKSSYIHYYTC